MEPEIKHVTMQGAGDAPGVIVYMGGAVLAVLSQLATGEWSLDWATASLKSLSGGFASIEPSRAP